MDSIIDFNNYSHERKTDHVISMQNCWEYDYAKNINEVNELDLNEIVLRLQKEDYLPDTANSLEHLLYLSTVRTDDDIKTPFSKKQQNKFNLASNTRKKVYIFFVINGLFILLTASFGYPNLVALSQCSQSNNTQCISQTSVLTAPATISFFGALMVGFMSLYATGILPDVSARKADRIQDKIGDLASKYLTLAKYWIDMYFMYPDKAIDIANRFDMDALKTRIKLKTHNTKSGDMLVNPLKEAWYFIKKKHILITFTEIENYLYSKMNAQQIIALSNRVLELERIVDEKDKKICELMKTTI